MPDCRDPIHSQGLCDKHRKRYERHGNPYLTRKPRCSTCAAIWRVMQRPGRTHPQLIDKFTDIWLLFHAGSTYVLVDRDAEGREYPLDIKEEPCDELC